MRRSSASSPSCPRSSARAAAELGAAVEATATLDLALACGLLSRRWRGAPVQVADEVRLLGARHPLLADETAVPIDLDLDGLRALVVSGPNTGGKTVALKTLGLAALLHQAGLRPPADTAVLPVFDAVLADIGDQQSIQMSLSTFSGHLGNIVRILAAASRRSLVLLDELAAGTDPAEGAALAQALLARLAEQARLTVVTTHFAELKEWASATDDAANAATAYDVETDTPLYRVALGRPGTSHALRVAERLGLDPAVVADARERVVPALLRAAELLAEAERAESAAAEEHAASEQARADAERLVKQAEERRAALEAEIERVRASADAEREAARAEAEQELREARAALEALREEIRAARRQERARGRAQPAAARAAERRRDRRLGAAAEEAGRVEELLRPLDEPLPVLAPLAPGDPVEARELGVQGVIAAIEGEEAEVVVQGGARVRLPVARLRPSARRRRRRGAGGESRGRRARATCPTSSTSAGMRADEAREAVRSFVDDAALAGLAEVAIVHGKGTGALRAAVRAELDAHPLVERHELGLGRRRVLGPARLTGSEIARSIRRTRRDCLEAQARTRPGRHGGARRLARRDPAVVELCVGRHDALVQLPAPAACRSGRPDGALRPHQEADAHGRPLPARLRSGLFTSGMTASLAHKQDTGSSEVPNDNYVVEEGHRVLWYILPSTARVTVLINTRGKGI